MRPFHRLLDWYIRWHWFYARVKYLDTVLYKTDTLTLERRVSSEMHRIVEAQSCSVRRRSPSVGSFSGADLLTQESVLQHRCYFVFRKRPELEWRQRCRIWIPELLITLLTISVSKLLGGLFTERGDAGSLRDFASLFQHNCWSRLRVAAMRLALHLLPQSPRILQRFERALR